MQHIHTNLIILQSYFTACQIVYDYLCALCVFVCVCRQRVYIEQKALDTIAHLCDGDARAALNGLQLAVQACVNKIVSAETHPPQDTVVQEVHVKEGLQRSHILYDKAGGYKLGYNINVGWELKYSGV